MSQSAILNYDPSRYDEPITKIQPVTIIRSDGKVFRILFPFKKLEGKSIEEKNRIVLQTLWVFERLDLVFSKRNPKEAIRVKSRLNEEQSEQALDAEIYEFAWLTARAIALNVLAVYLERAKTEEVVDRRGEPDIGASCKLTKALLERISDQLRNAIQNDQNAVDEVDRCIHRNMMAAAAVRVMQHQEITGLRPIENLWNISGFYLRPASRVLRLYKSTIARVAENYAAHLLEDFIRPAQMCIESLRALLFESPKKHLSHSEAITLLKNIMQGHIKDLEPISKPHTSSNK
jgi:hypothetical protein